MCFCYSLRYFSGTKLLTRCHYSIRWIWDECLWKNHIWVRKIMIENLSCMTNRLACLKCYCRLHRPCQYYYHLLYYIRFDVSHYVDLRDNIWLANGIFNYVWILRRSIYHAKYDFIIIHYRVRILNASVYSPNYYTIGDRI